MKNLAVFLQANGDTIRYLAIGTIEDGKLTGSVFGYEGSGTFSESYIVDGSYLPEREGFDEQEADMAKATSQEFVEALETKFETLSISDPDCSIHLVSDGYLLKLKDGVYTENFNITPPDYGLTNWDR